MRCSPISEKVAVGSREMPSSLTARLASPLFCPYSRAVKAALGRAIAVGKQRDGYIISYCPHVEVYPLG